MSIIVPRTCTEILPKNQDPPREPRCGLLETFRAAPAYVLLGDPGSGKSTAFEVEAKALGEGAVRMSVREFLRSYPTRGSTWRDKTLFIDGLDEMRVGSGDPRAVMDKVWAALDSLGRPAVRVSCREADWLGDNDRTALTSVSSDAKIATLRLDPLTDDGIVQILHDHPNVADPWEFMAQARERRVDGLLANPLTLKLLADAVGKAGTWPQSRRETFERACRQMAVEHNQEHEVADQPYPVDQLLDVSSELCAYQLLTNSEGWSLGHREADDEHIWLNDLDHPSLAMARRAVATRLFRGIGERRFAPAHQHIAEFLGARYLAQRIGKGLPVGRILSLITGDDGSVLSAFRGLHAWLAVHCDDVRGCLIDRDPGGVGLYGDLQEFSVEDKRRLIMRLDREVGDYGVSASAFAPLAALDMEHHIRRFLEDVHRDLDHQTVTWFLVRVLQQAEPVTDLAPLLLSVVRDDSRWSSVAKSALDAFTHVQMDSDERTGALKLLLDDIRNDRIPDPDGELLGTLLTHLYPHEVPPSELWKYLPLGGRPDFIGEFFLFWERRIHDQSSDADVGELLDNLYERLPGLRSAFRINYYVDILPSRLLARALQTQGDGQETPRLYNWLKVGAFSIHGAIGPDDESSQQIISWLEQRPTIQKAVFMEGLSRCTDGDRFDLCAAEVWDCLHHSTLPEDFGLRCLDTAVELVDTNLRVAQHLLRLAASRGLSQPTLMKRAHGYEALESYILRICDVQTGSRLQSIDATQEEADRKQQQWIDRIRADNDALLENQADPALLFHLGRAYFDRYRRAEGGHLLEADLAEVLENHELGERVLASLRKTVWRQDIPEIDEIFRLSSQSQVHPLGPPFLAGMDVMDPEQLGELGRRQMRLALAFYYSTPPDGGPDPPWYLKSLDSQPELVADVLVQFVTATIHSGKMSLDMYRLAHEPSHAQVAKIAAPRLLEKLPLHCEQQQLEALNLLMWAALQHMDRTALEVLIAEKLSHDDLDIVQRIHWVTVGAIIAPGNYLQKLVSLVEGDVGAIHAMAAVFGLGKQSAFLLNGLDAPTLQTLIALMGRTFAPLKLDGIVTLAMEASDQIQRMIDRLSMVDSADASRSFNHLLADDALSSWRSHLEQARDLQLAILGEANYRRPTLDQVRQTLCNSIPANAGDLAALLVDRLDAFAGQICGSNTDDWHQYWNEDSYGRPREPKHEDRCRDALLSRLRGHLPTGVDAQPEGQYADDNRSDIRVSYGAEFNVPVEIKKDRHPQLWSALRDQLMARYVSDPATGGHGVYLVFWFGDGKMPPPPQGRRPTGPVELRQRLEEQLTESERRRIAVRVIDVSPGGKECSA